MSTIRNKNKRICYQDYEPPTKRIVSEADILIKDLSNKQQIRTIDLQEILQNEQNFEKVSEYISPISGCSGTLLLDKYKVALKQLEYIEDLKGYGLSNDDIKLVVAYNNNMYAMYKNIEPEILQLRIERILNVIEQHKQNCLKESHPLSNISHKQNEALAIKPDSVETKLLKFALQNDKKCVTKNTAMDNIKMIEKTLFSHLDEVKLPPHKIQKQLRRYARKINSNLSLTDQIKQNKNTDAEECTFVQCSKWDEKGINHHENVASLSSTSNKVYTTTPSRPQSIYKLQNGKIIKLNSETNVKTVQISEKKLNIEEIRKQVKNYEIGIPSKILYLKNLPKYIQESDLHNLFRKFNPDGLSFRIMTGKMKGQVFVTFPDVDMAVEALNSINGTLVSEKPVVIEFGKHT